MFLISFSFLLKSLNQMGFLFWKKTLFIYFHEHTFLHALMPVLCQKVGVSCACLCALIPLKSIRSMHSGSTVHKALFRTEVSEFFIRKLLALSLLNSCVIPKCAKVALSFSITWLVEGQEVTGSQCILCSNLILQVYSIYLCSHRSTVNFSQGIQGNSLEINISFCCAAFVLMQYKHSCTCCLMSCEMLGHQTAW